MVSILLSFPILAKGSIHYLSVPFATSFGTKKQTNPEIAVERVRSAMDSIGSDKLVFLPRDIWYPKGCVTGLLDEYHDVDILCNARIDTVMYNLLSERTDKKILPKKYGERLSPEDFDFESLETGDWKIGAYSALPWLWEGG